MNKNNHKKIHIVLLFGGKSTEHEVSIKSARSVFKMVDKEKYKVTLIGIDKNGVWIPFDELQLFSSERIILSEQKQNITNTQIIPYDANGRFIIKNGENIEMIDVVFPVLHGTFGEDGTIQGLLKLANVPFVGVDILGSAIGIDKEVTKRLLRDRGLPVAPFIVYKKHEIKDIIFDKIKHDLGLPFFVKPANLGSSIGITKVHSISEFKKAINFAFKYDNKILIEEYIKGREIECSILGNEKPTASVCGEIISGHEFYSYEAKYLDGNNVILSIPAKISKSLVKKIQLLAIETFKTLCCEGMARVDFFVTKDKKIYINEINTMPGFTSGSMYPKLWEASGISNKKLIDVLINLAIKRFKDKNKLLTSKDII
jgi:D-alanine-D-alanine ligase